MCYAMKPISLFLSLFPIYLIYDPYKKVKASKRVNGHHAKERRGDQTMKKEQQSMTSPN